MKVPRNAVSAVLYYRTFKYGGDSEELVTTPRKAVAAYKKLAKSSNSKWVYTQEHSYVTFYDENGHKID